eukprot:77137_1
MANAGTAEMTNSFKNDIESPAVDAGSKSKSNDAQEPLLQRVSTLTKMNSLHAALLRQESTGYENIVHGCRIGWFEIFLMIMVLCVLSCFGSIFYAIYGGNELNIMWDQYSEQDIDAWCNGMYEEAFTYKEGSQTRDWSAYFDIMISCGLMNAGLYLLVILYCCAYQPACKGIGMTHAFSEGIEYAWFIGLMFAALWCVYFRKCLQYYNRVGEYCDEGTLIYDDTMDIFTWFYYVIIVEFVKGGIMLIIFLVGIVIMFCGGSKIDNDKWDGHGIF